MSKSVIKLLSETAPAPDAARKDAFLRAHHRAFLSHDTSTKGMILTQLRFVSVWVWIVTALMMVLTVICVSTQSTNLRDMISSMMPFVSCLAVFQTYRSKKYGMLELEQATFHTGRRVLLARISGIGCVQLLCIVAATALLGFGLQRDFLQTGYALIIPYLLTSVISMEVEYRMPSNGFWVSAGVAVVVSVFTQILLTDAEMLSQIPQTLWMVTLLVLCISLFYEMRKLYVVEELAWN